MQIILKKSVTNVGLVGDVVDVKPGFYRNYLEPQGLAFLARTGNIKEMEHRKKVVEARKIKEKEVALAVKKRMEDLALTLEHSAGSHDKLYGAVTTQEIVARLKDQGFEVDRRYVQMSAPIKTVGSHTVAVKLHPEVTADVKVEVKAKEEKKAKSEGADTPKKTKPEKPKADEVPTENKE